MIAGYDIGGNAGLVGNTYNFNLWGVYRTAQSEGFADLVGAMKAEAAAAGAENISILGTHIVNPALMRAGIIARGFGLSFEAINESTILLTGGLIIP
jgi:hypothetical protein